VIIFGGDGAADFYLDNAPGPGYRGNSLAVRIPNGRVIPVHDEQEAMVIAGGPARYSGRNPVTELVDRSARIIASPVRPVVDYAAFGADVVVGGAVEAAGYKVENYLSPRMANLQAARSGTAPYYGSYDFIDPTPLYGNDAVNAAVYDTAVDTIMIFGPPAALRVGRGYQLVLEGASARSLTTPLYVPRAAAAERSLGSNFTRPLGPRWMTSDLPTGGFDDIISLNGGAAPASGTVPGVPATGNPSTVVIYRKMSAAEAAKTLDTKQLQPKVPGSNGKKYLSESLDKVKEFENKGVPKGTDEVIVEFTLDKAKYDALLADKVPQKLVGETPGGKGKIEYHYEGLPQDGPHINIGVPDTQLPGFNGAVIDVRILPPKK
jgi:hypothetical protein